MKLTPLLKLLAVAAFSYGTIATANSQAETEELRKIFNDNKSSVYGLKGTLKLTINFQGKVQRQEAQVWANATVISDNLLVTTYSAVNPDLGIHRPGLEVVKELASLKIINAEGVEFAAKIVLHDEDLGLAYISIDPKAKNAANWKPQVVDISKDVELKHLEKTVIISRHNSNFNYQSGVVTGAVSVVFTKPRKGYLIRGATMGSPIFNTLGEFVGITIAKKAGVQGKNSVPLTLPAKYIRNLSEIAAKKAAELKK